MKRFLLSSSTLASLIFLAIVPSQAADAVLEPAAPFAPSWTGFYIGVHAGGAFGNYGDYEEGDPGEFQFSDRFGVIGVHAGYDYQFAPRWVGGLEFDYTHLDSEVAPITPDETRFWVHSQYSVSGRLGYLVTPRTLVYGRLGYSAMDVEALAGFAGFESETVSAVRVGFGAETFLSDNLTFRVEANYLRTTNEFEAENGITYDPRLLLATAGLTWRFGADAGSSFGAAEAPQVDWQGFSVGAYGGYGFGALERDVEVAATTIGPFAAETPLAGVFVGYDFALTDRLVLGVEAEAAWMNAEFRDPEGNSPLAGAPTHFGTVDAMFAVSARAGVAVSPSTLVYVKGGYAGLRTTAEEEFFALGDGGDEILDGYQVGVGIESALTEQVTLRVEASYVEALEGIIVDNTQPDQNTLTPSLLLGKVGLAWRW